MTTTITSLLRGTDGHRMADCCTAWQHADPARAHVSIGVWAHDLTLTAIKATETAVAKNAAYVAAAVAVSVTSTVADRPVTSTWGDSTLARLDTARAHTFGRPSRAAYQAQQIVAWCRAHPADLWGPHLGLNLAVGQKQAAVDRTAALGLGWVVYPREHGWGDDDSAAIIAHAHDVGLKVFVNCQEHGVHTPGPHNYDYDNGWAGAAAFADWCAHWVDYGADAIQIGNEWNNLGAFWNGSTLVDMSDRAFLHQLCGTAIRAKSATVKIITVGWSPASAPYDPVTATKNLFAARDWSHLATLMDGVGHHPYNWRSWPDVVLTDGSGKLRFDWNACAQCPAIYAAGGQKPLWFSEYGGPSGGVTGTMSNGMVFSEDTQATLFERYGVAFNNHLRAGVNIEVACSFPVSDGTGGEDAFGVYRTDGSLKPAGKVLRDFALTVR